MTADKVVDASAIAALIFNESKRAVVESRLNGMLLHAPVFIDVEMASVCLKKIRAALYPRDTIMKMYSTYASIAIQRSEISFLGVLDLAERTGLSFYDASYLWLARHLGAELVTLDHDLEKASKKP